MSAHIDSDFAELKVFKEDYRRIRGSAAVMCGKPMAYRQNIYFSEAQPPLVIKDRVPERQSLSAQHCGRAAE